ncbi:SipW-dependent-type signal peptide-containing protein [Halobellus clavatus]|jgi:predicted ribosomally synthesized peptide with SipW-like signal peptide|uniref:SipW-cognate class signal peptide n=1 Tax=Halobellus clavatus TaxID=660517 RepID=A0A1H3H3Y6_9EURY|nr:SipW-dependent-type signal peptide-containing protein [Halobellus clavatus]SDY10222.1 SipW-cognate class signal peptide [Halobellus clavatus]
MTERFEISRRKALAALGTIGVASAGAGLGTSALFSDQETFEDNTITAGTLDMTVTATQVANSSDAPGEIYYDNLGLQSTIGASPGDGDGIRLEADDVKPGDWVVYCFEIDVEDNPGYVTIHADNLLESGGANPEPEQEAEGDSGNSADLGEALLVTHWGTFNGTDPAYDGNGTVTNAGDVANNMLTDLENLDSTTNNAGGVAVGAYGAPTDLDGNATVGSDSVHYTNLREFVETYDTDPTSAPFNNTNQPPNSSGVLIRSDDANSTNNPDAPQLVGGANTTGPGTFTYYMLVELPFDVGNEVQGDSVQFDLGWSTEQTRNNDDPRSGISFNNSS